MTRILIAEDEFRIRDVLVDTFQHAGFDVVNAANGMEALQKVTECEPDIVLLDVMIPGLNGFQVIEQMKTNPETSSIPVVVLTAMPAAQGEQAALERGASNYITKPCETGLLEATIRVALRDAGVSLPTDSDEKQEQSADFVSPEITNQMVMEAARLNQRRSTANGEGEEIQVIKTGEKLPALEQKMGGGLPLGTVTLAVGSASSGKSSLCQHLLYGALEGGYGVAYYTSEQNAHHLLSQMISIGLDVSQYFREEKVQVYDVPSPSVSETPEKLLNQLTQSMERLSSGAEFIVIDSISDLAGSCSEQAVIAFFNACRRLSKQGKTILVSVHSYALGSEMFSRLRALCDGYLSLGSEEVRGKSVRTLEVQKINTTEKTRDNMVSFVVEPEIGMRIIPLNKSQV